MQFYFSKKKDGTLLDGIPKGFFIHEHPDGMVYLRSKAGQLVTDDEILRVQGALPKPNEKLKYALDFKKDTITIHEADLPRFVPLHFLGSPDPERIQTILEASAHYMPLLRFVLRDRTQNLFQTERYCFRGSIDAWILVGPPGLLASLVEEYVVHLGKDSFYDLF